MAEYYTRIAFDGPVPTVPVIIQASIGVPVTGVIVNGALPAGLTLKICRKGAPSGVILSGSPAATAGGDAALDFFCPPARDGIAFLFDVAVPGASVELVLVTSGGELSRA